MNESHDMPGCAHVRAGRDIELRMRNYTQEVRWYHTMYHGQEDSHTWCSIMHVKSQ